ncbi:TetR family transcriptional regulator [Amycolatopsis sp. NPDC088138]|uniref:TetR family transcriptional regulator n=1 Tax=Amycolatopsis sp. NPDC088138 TaxID=3363938 RepID=UPI003812F254
MASPNTNRQRMLDAGAEILLRDGMKILERGIPVEDVAARAGLSKNTFFNVFQSKEKYLDELIVSLSAVQEDVTSELSTMIDRVLLDSQGDLHSTVRAVCDWDFQTVKHDPGTLAQLAVFLLGRKHPEAMRGLREVYARYDNTTMLAYERILASWGASMRKPFSSKLVAVALTALVEGLALRSIFDPEAVPDDLFGDLTIALIAAIVDPDHNHEHINDVVAPISEQVQLKFASAKPDGLPEDPRAAILDAARTEFGVRGYFLTTFSLIAARAHVPSPVLRQLFPSKAAIIIDALDGPCERLAQQVDDDVKLSYPPQETITRHLGRLENLATQNPEFVQALLMLAAHETAASPDMNVVVKRELDLPQMLVPTIERAQKAGAFRADIPAYDAAAMLTNALFLHWFTRRDAPPQEHARLISQLLLDGLAVPEPTE